nr:glycosyltransferase [uncultured Flavobacterium sp.]
MKSNSIFLSFSLGNTSVSDYFVSLSHEFSKEYDVVIFSDKLKPEHITFPPNIQVLYWPSKRPTKLKDGIFLYNLIKQYKPKMTISIFGSVNIFILVGFLCGVKNRIAWIRTLSTQFPSQKINQIRKSIIYKFSTQLIANSYATKQDVINVFNVNENKIKVLYNSVKKYDIQEVEFDKNKITYVGRLHKSKGVDTLIKAFNILLNEYPNIHLDIIGSGPENEYLQNLVNSLKIENKVNFLGVKNKKEVLLSFKESYCAVVPSTSEAFGFTVIEAMSMKTCVIGANNTGVKEIIEDKQSGLLFKTSDEIDLAAKMESIFQNQNLRNQLAINGYNRFLNNFEVDMAIKRDTIFFNNLFN